MKSILSMQMCRQRNNMPEEHENMYMKSRTCVWAASTQTHKPPIMPAVSYSVSQQGVMSQSQWDCFTLPLPSYLQSLRAARAGAHGRGVLS